MTEQSTTPTTRVPWGDATDLIRLLDVRPDGENEYVSGVHDGPSGHRGVVEGSQMLGQAIVAAGRHAPGRRVVHASMIFPRVANTADPLHVHLDQISGGRTFTALGAQVRQNGKVSASGTLLLGVTSDDVMRHAEPAPDTAGPEDATPYEMGVTGREVRFVDNAYTADPDAPVGPPVLDAWVRFREVPDDPYLHAALLTQFTGHASIAAAMRPHAGIGQLQAHRTLSTGINAITLSLHADVRADRWMLYRHRSTFAGDGMTHSECRVHDEDGALLASFTVEAMVRPMPGGHAVDGRTSL